MPLLDEEIDRACIRCADLQSFHNNFAVDFSWNEDFIKELEQHDKLTELSQSDEGTGVADRFHDS